jgi:hypothetical protein
VAKPPKKSQKRDEILKEKNNPSKIDGLVKSSWNALCASIGDNNLEAHHFFVNICLFASGKMPNRQ